MSDHLLKFTLNYYLAITWKIIQLETSHSLVAQFKTQIS